MNCPVCGYPLDDPGVIRVTPETVRDRYEIWLARKNGGHPARVTERIPVIEIGTAPPKGTSEEPTAGQS